MEHPKSNGLTVAFWLNLLFAIIELVGGMMTNSTAIVADAFHDFMDAVAIGAAVWLENVSNTKRTATFSYGYKRFTLLSALGLSALLLGGCVWMCMSAYQSFLHPKIVNSAGMLGLAVLGIAINGFAFIRIKQTHQHSLNSKAIMFHLLEDVLGWVAVLVGAVVMYFTNRYWIDGVLTIAIAVFIGYNAIRNLIETLRVMLQSVPPTVNIAQLSAELNQIDGIENIHDLHVWTMDGYYHIGTLHVVVSTLGQHKQDEILASALQVMTKHHIQHPTVQLESATSQCEFKTC